MRQAIVMAVLVMVLAGSQVSTAVTCSLSELQACFSNDFYSNITVSVTTTTTPVTTTKFVITCITTIQLVLHEVVRTALMHMSVHKEPNLGTVFYFSQLHGDCRHLWAYHSHLLIETNIQTSPVCKEILLLIMFFFLYLFLKILEL
ncbi:hypothetical protein OSB04_014423 [Centaurea solstitialis]|uniref:Uncharacterized protein n=1 Tax=Centaurea solstitialis TaxID=347529 RepID=A0AA38SX99_9ASTR|nr:hypothetical protein OSB04_014423 [Centaurea solstitialis]